MSNSSLHAAYINKYDEFYTLYEDIQKELIHYTSQFKNKVIYCNCDDAYESNFVKYFLDNFNKLRIKKLIASCYVQKNHYIQTSLFENKEIHFDVIKKAHMIEINKVGEKTDICSVLKIKSNKFKILNDGDFRSNECINLLKQSDIVVTNPPFSLTREYIKQLIDYKKKFLIINTLPHIANKYIFNLILQNKVRLGISIKSSSTYFIVPRITSKEYKIDDNGNMLAPLGNIRWLTNLDINIQNTFIPLTCKYNELDYPKYDNCDAIEVNKVKNIPYDYTGTIGVPITFLDKYNPKQFKIVGYLYGSDRKHLRLNGKELFFRILIKKL